MEMVFPNKINIVNVSLQKYIISKDQLELMKRRFIFSNTIRFILFTILSVFVFPWIVSVIKLKYKVDLFFILLN